MAIKNSNNELVFNKFGSIYFDYPTFKSEIEDKVIAITGNKEYVDETKMYQSFQSLYKIFLNAKGQRWMRYEKAEFEGYFINKMIELLPTLFIKQRMLVNDKFDTLKELSELGKLPQSILDGVISSETFNSKGDEYDPLNDNANQKQRSKSQASDENLLRASQTLMASEITNQVTLFCNEFDELFVSLSTEQLKELMGSDYYKKATLYDCLKTIITGDEVHFEDATETIYIRDNTFIKNMNTDPQDNNIQLKGSSNKVFDLDLFVDNISLETRLAKFDLEVVKPIRDQANIIGLNVVVDENDTEHQLDGGTTQRIYNITKINALVRQCEQMIMDGDIKTLSDAKAYTDAEIKKLVNPLLRDYEVIATLDPTQSIDVDLSKPNDFIQQWRSGGTSSESSRYLNFALIDGINRMYDTSSTLTSLKIVGNKITLDFSNGDYPVTIYQRKGA